MLVNKEISRREFLKVSALAGAGLLAAGCAKTVAPQPTVEKKEPEAAATPTPVPQVEAEDKESPVFIDQVKAGTLASVGERLPQSPIVVEPVEEIGTYGGSWRHICPDDNCGWMLMTTHVEPFVKWNRDSTGHIPNLLQSWEWNSDATVLTAHMQKGVKWSDGEPLSVDDYLFWWNDCVLNDEVPIREPAGTRVAGTLVEIEKVDDYTLKYTFPRANPLFLPYHSRGFYHSAWFTIPAHYMKQFHPTYNTELGAADIEDFVDHYNNRTQFIDMPGYNMWKTDAFNTGVSKKLGQNPYYWKVDPEGKQLPYITTVDITIVQEWREIVALKAQAGELDCQVRDFDLKDVPMLLENADNGDYRVVMWDRGDFGWPALLLGYDFPDEEIVDLMYDKRFRQALSWAINRVRINEIVSLGLAKAKNASMSGNSPEFQSPEGRKVYEEWSASYATHDPDKAKSLLEEVGVVDKSGDGWLDRPSGAPLELIVDIGVTDQKSIDAMDLVKEDWDAIGLKTTLNVIDGALLGQRANQGEYMIWARGSNCAWGLVSAPPHWTPIEYAGYAIAPRIGLWYQTGGKEGVAPRPGSVLEKLQDVYTELIQIIDPVEREKRLLDAYRLHIDEGPVNIGVMGEHQSPCVVKNNFRNFPDFGVPGSWDLGYPGTACPEQFFFKG